MGNSSYSKIVGIGNMCIKTNVGWMLILKDVQHVPNLRMNVLSTLALGRACYSNHLGNGRWKLCKGLLVIARGHACCGMYRIHVRACKKKYNAIKVFEKTQQLRVDINGVAAKRVKFSLPESDLNEEVIFDEKYHDARKNDEVKDREGLEQGEPRNWIKDIQSEINSLRKKDINFDEIFSVLVKIMKKVKSGVGLAGMNCN